MDFNDLARSGTAPEPSKVKVNQMVGQTLPLRPKTRSADNDMQDFRIELRTNKNNYQHHSYPTDGDSFQDVTENQSNEFIRAMESYQADFESWSRGRTDFDPNGMSNTNARQGTAVGGRRSAKDGKKIQSSALSAYTQNIPQIVLQTSKKSTKPTSSPRTTQPKSDAKADIRAVYGADVMDRATGSGQRPRSQKQSTTGNSNPNSPKVSQAFSFPEEAVPPSPERREIIPSSQSSDYEPSGSKTTPSSASRLRANVAQHASSEMNSATTAAAAMKPFSIRKAVPNTSSGPRQVTRPFSHTEGVRTSVSQGATAGTPAPRASLDTPTSSSSSKRVARKSATNAGTAAASLLKSSLVPGGSTRGVSGRAERSGSKGNESDTDFIENDSNTDFSDSSEYIAKQRAADHSARKQPQDIAASVGIAGAGNVTKFHSSSTSSDTRDYKPPLAGKSPVKDSATKRHSPSPTLYLDGLNLGKVDSDQALLDIIQDTDNLECSFDESPILAAYLQQKSHVSHAASQQEHPVSDGSTRPQSRKLYLGAEKEAAGHTTFSVKDNKSPSYKTAPRSAGARYPVPHAPKTMSTSNGADTGTSSSSFADGPAPPLRKMSSFNEIIPQSRKWHEIPPSNNLPDQRPPSRQSSAFPVHLADEPSGNKAVSIRTDETKHTKRTSSPTAARGVASPPVRPSMRWDNVDLGDDEDVDEGEIEEALHHDDALSEVSSNDDTPSKYTTKNNAYSSAKNNAPSSVRASPTQVSSALGPSSSTGHQTVAPARTHIGIVRTAPTDDRPDTAVGADLYAAEFTTIQRPPSRQKIAAQHLFEGGPPPPSRAGTVAADATRGGSRAATASNPSTDAQPMSRSATRPSTSHYNPRDDGFTELDTDEAAAVPFVIKFNSSEANDFEEFDLDELALSPSRSQANYDRDGGPRRKSHNNGTGHSRSPSNNSNNWADFTDDGLNMASPGYRPQTMGNAVKAPRLLGVIPPSGLAPPRTKSAGEVVRSPGAPLRREGNNILLSHQQPHAPSVSRGAAAGSYGSHVLRENIKAGLGDYTAGPAPHRTLNSGWTEVSGSHTSPRTQVCFEVVSSFLVS